MAPRPPGRRIPPVETPARARLPGGDLEYTLRRSSRARRLRVTIDPRRGVIATVPGVRTPESRARALVEPFLAERETWLRRHVARHAAAAAGIAAAGPVRDGSLLRYRGEPHRVRVLAGSPVQPPLPRRARGRGREDQLVVTLGGDRTAAALGDPGGVAAGPRAGCARRRDRAPRARAWRDPRARHRARHAQPMGERVARRPTLVLVAARAGTARCPRDGGRP